MIGAAFARKAASIPASCVLPRRNFYHFSGSIDKLFFVYDGLARGVKPGQGAAVICASGGSENGLTAKLTALVRHTEDRALS